LLQLINNTPGLLGVLITDREGVPLIRANHESAPELAMRPASLSTISCAAERANKMGLGLTEFITCQYENYTLINFNYDPLVVTLVADSKANIGLLIDLKEEFSPIVDHLKPMVNVLAEKA